MGSPGESSNVAPRLSGSAPPAPASSPGPSSAATFAVAPKPAEVSLQLRGLARVLPQDPNPVPLQIPADLTEEQLRGGYGFALALWLFSGLLLTSTLVLLFGLLAYQRWFAAGPSRSRHPSPPSRRSSPSHR